MITISEPLLEKGGDIVSYPLKFLVALSLGSLETTSDMSPDKGHRNGVGTRSMAAALVNLARDGC